MRIPAPSSRRQTFSFTKIFPPDTVQSDFFTNTTLPLVKDLLNGENGLIFAYGVTNSGKTYTIQGKNNVEEAGLLPRTLDVVFNSIEGLHLDQLAASEAPEEDQETQETVPVPDVDNAFLRELLPESERGEWDAQDQTSRFSSPIK